MSRVALALSVAALAAFVQAAGVSAAPAQAAAQGDKPLVAPADPSVTLSDQARQVSQVAHDRGDREYIMIDKAHGRLMLFQNDEAVLQTPVITGASLQDKYSARLLAMPEGHKFTQDEKITPAGRFTAKRMNDPELGTVLELQEIHGKGWWIAIHSVWLGIPSEHRAERLASADPDQEHVSFGCINVTPGAMKFLLTHLGRKAVTPVYVLPQDEAATGSAFPSARQASASAPN